MLKVRSMMKITSARQLSTEYKLDRHHHLLGLIVVFAWIAYHPASMVRKLKYHEQK